MTVNFKSVVVLAIAVAVALVTGCPKKVQPGGAPASSPSVTDGSASNVVPVIETNVVPVTVSWQTDLEAAKKLSTESGKPIFALFTGQAWCPPCIMLEKEVLNSSEFSNFITENTVPAKFVIPAGWPKDDSNLALLKKYMGSQCSVPSIYMLDANGAVITRYELSNNSFTPKGFVAGLKTVVDKIQASRSVAQDTPAL